MSPVKPTISILSPATGSVFVLPLPPRTALSEAHFAEEGSGEGELGGASVEGEDETDEEGGGEEVELVELIEEAQELVRVPVQIELKAESFEGWGGSAALEAPYEGGGGCDIDYGAEYFLSEDVARAPAHRGALVSGRR